MPHTFIKLFLLLILFLKPSRPQSKYRQLTHDEQVHNCENLFEKHPLGKLILNQRSGSLKGRLANRVQLAEAYRKDKDRERFQLSIGCGLDETVTCFPDDSNEEEKKLILQNLHLIHSAKISVANPTDADIKAHEADGTFHDIQSNICAGQSCENNRCSCGLNECRLRSAIISLSTKDTACIDFEARPIEHIKIPRGRKCSAYENDTTSIHKNTGTRISTALPQIIILIQIIILVQLNKLDI